MDNFNVTLLKIFTKQHGFVTNEDINNLISINPKLTVLVRCGNGRFTVTIAELNEVVAQIDAGTHQKYDYVRDISIPVPLN